MHLRHCLAVRRVRNHLRHPTSKLKSTQHRVRPAVQAVLACADSCKPCVKHTISCRPNGLPQAAISRLYPLRERDIGERTMSAACHAVIRIHPCGHMLLPHSTRKDKPQCNPFHPSAHKAPTCCTAQTHPSPLLDPCCRRLAAAPNSLNCLLTACAASCRVSCHPLAPQPSAAPLALQ